MLKLATFTFFFIGTAKPIIISDSGFICSTSKSNITTPLASPSIPVGCSPKIDWNGLTSTWCLTNGSTGVYQPGFGYTDTCAQAAIIPFFPSGSTFYTGQVLNLSFSETNIAAPETLVVSYAGKTLGSTSVSSGFFQTTLAGNAQLITNGSLSITTTNPFIQANISGFSIATSKIVTLWLFTSSGSITSGSTVPCGQNFTVIWNSVGMASVGTASVSIASSGGGGGGGGTVGTAVTGIAVVSTGNNTVNYICPLSYTPPGFGNSYAVTVTVGSYTLRSFTFSLAAAPSPTPTPSSTPTQTPTASLSFGATPSNTATPSSTVPGTPSRTPTISVTPSITPTSSITGSPSFSSAPSVTPSNTETSSATPTPRTIIDGSAILAAQSTQNTVMAASIAGGILALILSVFVGYRLYERNQLHERRMRRLRTAGNNNVVSQRQIYIQSETNMAGNMTMYQVQAPGRGRRAQR
jgi:hypothetical protein